MRPSPVRIAALIIPVLLLAPTAFALPIYPATFGTASYTNNFFGVLDNSFSFSGPLVSINGSGVTAAQPPTENLGVPFNLTLFLIIDDNGDESGNAIGNGISYPSVQFVDLASTTINNSTPITLVAGNLTVSVPATLNGLIAVCSPNNLCASGGGSDVFDVSFALSGTLTVTYSQFNVGSPYALTNAVFTTGVPEPSSLLLLGSSFLAPLFRFRKLAGLIK
jgi:PEP-CTERM motif-containing protein